MRLIRNFRLYGKNMRRNNVMKKCCIYCKKIIKTKSSLVRISGETAHLFCAIRNSTTSKWTFWNDGSYRKVEVGLFQRGKKIKSLKHFCPCLIGEKLWQEWDLAKFEKRDNIIKYKSNSDMVKLESESKFEGALQKYRFHIENCSVCQGELDKVYENENTKKQTLCERKTNYVTYSSDIPKDYVEQVRDEEE